METIPTPRSTNAIVEWSDQLPHGGIPWVPSHVAIQLERELHIAKQALEHIKATTGGAHIAVAKAEAINALNEINTLSA
jgi:hypothetical protein